jgi:predicted DsbA family dithiol-disulfide isomerase
MLSQILSVLGALLEITQLDRALKANKSHPFQIEWHPFQLNPNMPIIGMYRRDYLEHKFGNKIQAVEFYSTIEEKALELDLTINFSGIKLTPNTINAHRLIHWAGLEHKQQQMIDELFNSYFYNAIDIGDHDALCDIACKVGIIRNMVARLLNGDSDIELIKERDAHSRQMGVTAVPTFIIANQNVVSGSQTSELWGCIINELQEDSES